MKIDVREYIPDNETKERIFIKPKSLDSKAAAYRYAVVEHITEEWFDEINSERANTRDMPYDLVELYENACEIMLKIRSRERDILLG